jgi:hypothetical protein
MTIEVFVQFFDKDGQRLIEYKFLGHGDMPVPAGAVRMETRIIAR